MEPMACLSTNARVDGSRLKAGTTEKAHLALLPPHFVGDLDCEPQFGPLLVLGQDVALFGRGKAALRRQRELLERGEFRGLFQPALDIVFSLELAGLRGDDADHPDLVAPRRIAQRLEAAGAVGI